MIDSQPARTVENSSAEPQIRIVIVVASVHHGNTRKIAEAMADALGAEVMTPADASTVNLADYDLVGFGSGIYFGRHHTSLRQLLNSLDRLPRSAFVFSTAGLPCFARLFHYPVRRVLYSGGCRVINEFSCRGWDTFGPLLMVGGINWQHPNLRDIARAKTFARDVYRSAARTEITPAK